MRLKMAYLMVYFGLGYRGEYMKILKQPIELDAEYLTFPLNSKQEWVNEALLEEKLWFAEGNWYLDTQSGVKQGEVGDVLIKEIDGELNIRNKELFKKMYIIME